MIQNRRRLAALLASMMLTASLTGLLWTVAAENEDPTGEISTGTVASATEDDGEISIPATDAQDPDPVPVTTESLSDTEEPITTGEPTITGESTVTDELTEEPDVTKEPLRTEEPSTTEKPAVTDEPTVTDSSSTASTTKPEFATTPDTGTSTLPVTTPEVPSVTTDLPQTEEVTTTTKGPSTAPNISTDAPTSQQPISLSTDANTQVQTEAGSIVITTPFGQQDSFSGTENSEFRTEESGTSALSGSSLSENRESESGIGIVAVICSVLALISGLILAVLKFIH